MFDMSLKNYRNYINLEGAKEIQMKKGYMSIINKMIEPHEKQFYSKLNLEHVLSRILLCSSLKSDNDASECEHCKYIQDKNKIVLKLTNRAKSKEIVVICDHVICTMSLGVLKATFKDMVKPTDLIPNEKLNVISRLGFGITDKVI